MENKTIEKIRKAVKESWKNEETRRKRIEGIRNYWKSPEGKKQKEEFRKRMLKHNPNDDPEVREKIRRGVKKSWEKADRRLKQTKALKGRPKPKLKGRKRPQEVIDKMIKNHWSNDPNKRKKVIEKISEALSGENNPMKRPETVKKLKQTLRENPRIITKEQRELISRKSKEMWSDPNKRRKIIKATLEASHRRPNYVEKRVINILDKFSLPFKYVGDGTKIIAGKNPDFIGNSKEKIIEIFGRHWHQKSDEKDRKEVFREKGYETLVLWADEINDMTDYQIRDCIIKFLGGKE